jgi:predicted aspartyl protease
LNLDKNQNRRKGLLLFRAVTAFLFLPGFAWAQDPPTIAPPVAPAAATLSINRHSSRVWLPVRLNGSGPYSFLLDSGFDLTMIHPELADTLGLKSAGGVWILGIAGRERATYYRGARFDLNGLAYSPRRVAALPSDRNRRRKRDGILGSSFFRRFVVVVDSEAGQVRLCEPDQFHYTGEGQVIPLQFADDTPVIEAAVASANHAAVQARFEIDTGCDGGLCLGRDFLDANAWLLPDGKGRRSGRSGVGGGAATMDGHIPRLQMGSLRVEDPSAHFFVKGSPAGPGRAGHIGWEALRGFKVIFDYSKSRLILETSQRSRPSID